MRFLALLQDERQGTQRCVKLGFASLNQPALPLAPYPSELQRDGFPILHVLDWHNNCFTAKWITSLIGWHFLCEKQNTLKSCPSIYQGFGPHVVRAPLGAGLPARPTGISGWPLRSGIGCGERRAILTNTLP